MADHSARGKKLAEDKKYVEAIAAYTSALQQSPTSPQYFIERSSAYLKAGKLQESLNDAEHAVVYAKQREKRELIVTAQLRRGIALFRFDRYADAAFVLGIVKKLQEKETTHAMWLKKSEDKLSAMEEGDERRNVTVQEVPMLDANTSGGAGKTGNGSVSYQVKAPPPLPQQTPIDKIRHDWYQNNEFVYFTLLAKGVPKESAKVEILERSLSISFPVAASNSDYDFTLDPLFAAVQPENSTVRVLTTKIEVILAKTVAGQKWSKLESDEPVTAGAEDSTSEPTSDNVAKRAVFAAPAAGPVYPTSSKSGPKNWDKITDDLGKSDKKHKSGGIEDDDDYEGGDEANHFFKKLFKGSSPEVQRAMMKSYTESNGTALSTNWEEVSKAKVETTPPDGMEAKKWG
ncbi:hypothetical protein B0A48_00907 [Cryoendolithus antarcticus]|uniref:SGS-domain-containing protein n=1 Tax=Cryoendolithus antarcticus TaxID=1507870 RepID=A0A1V8TS43_9PEZI|nr:hypothetical protein B0A48_00907 [Cryoendolithus antarcticus]